MEKSSMRPQPEKGIPGSPREWLIHAESDLKLACLARDSEGVLPEQSCFHSQQTAEKALKAVLLFNKIDFPLTHDIEELLELGKQGGLTLPSQIEEVGSLTPDAVEARYPGHFEEITSPDVDEAIRVAEVVLQWAREIVGES